MLQNDEQRELDGLHRLDPQVISAVYERYFPDVYRFVRFRINDEHVAEDISSDVFVRLLDAIHARRPPQTSIRAWLIATAAHALTDHFRKSYRHPTENLPETFPADSDDPSADVEQRERSRRLKEALAVLTEEQQHVLNLRFNEGYSLEETAALMKKNINAIKQLQFRALAALNRKIGKMP
jgi:RNA polymerase sigma-70 factor, ECF subfamily